MGKMIMTENYCDECDEVIHALVDEDDFNSFKIGRVICPKCKAIVRMCNECEHQPSSCGKGCPYVNSAIVEALNDYDYIRWVRDHNKNGLTGYLKGDMGDYYKKIAEEVNALDTPTTEQLVDVLKLTRPDDVEEAAERLEESQGDSIGADNIRKVYSWIDRISKE